MQEKNELKTKPRLVCLLFAWFFFFVGLVFDSDGDVFCVSAFVVDTIFGSFSFSVVEVSVVEKGGCVFVLH